MLASLRSGKNERVDDSRTDNGPKVLMMDQVESLLH